jgi:hypothetical protein
MGPLTADSKHYSSLNISYAANGVTSRVLTMVWSVTLGITSFLDSVHRPVQSCLGLCG